MEVITAFFDILKVLWFLFWIYSGFAACYILFFAVASLFHRPKTPPFSNTLRKIAVLIPAYKEDAVIHEVAVEALKQTYPRDQFDVVIIADSLQPATLDQLRQLPVRLIEVTFDLSTKSKALNHAMAVLPDDYNIALVLDADNIMEPRFLEKINRAFDAGFSIVQAHRVAKNRNTAFAVLDAISEEINNAIFRKGHRAVGLSSALIGSGMAFDYSLFKTRMAGIHAVGGFDKELELTLLRDGMTIEFLNDALVYDEKVQLAKVFQHQRKRWLSAQFIYFRRFAVPGIKSLLLKGNINFADKVYQMITIPRVILFGISLLSSMLLAVLVLLLPEDAYLRQQLWRWLVVFAMVMVVFLCSIPRSFYNRTTFLALKMLPKAFFTMLLSLFKLKGANQKFIHTEHGVHPTNENNQNRKAK